MRHRPPVGSLARIKGAIALNIAGSLPPSARRVSRRWWAGCAGIWALALLVRLGHLWLLQDDPLGHVLMGDARRYHEWGTEIAAGDWLGSETFYQAPLYPYFIGGLYWIFGVGQMTVRIAQAVLGATGCLLLALAGRRLFSPRTGWLAGLLLAVFAPAVFYDGILQKTSLGSFLTCGLLAATASAVYRPRRLWRWSLWGVVLGALMLIRENALVLAGLLPIWLAFGWRKHSLASRCGWLGAVAVGLAVVLFPVALRNRLVGGEWLLTTSQFGPNFYIGNSAYANGRYIPLRQDRGGPEYERIDATELAERDVGRELSPREVSAYWTEAALSDMRADWPGWLELMGRKWFLIGNSAEIIDTEDIYSHADASWILRSLLAVWHFGVLAPLAALGLVLAWTSWRRQGVVLLFIAIYAASVSLFYVFGRYRFPLVPALMLFAAAGLVRLPSRFRRPFGRLAWGGLVLALVAVLANWPGEPHDPMRSNTHYMLAVNMERDGYPIERIVRELDLAEHYDPEYAAVLRVRANLEWSRGQTAAALKYYRRCLDLDGDFLLARYDYGLALMRLGQPAEALEHLEFLNQWEPDFGEGAVQYLLGLAYLNLRQPARAEVHFEAAREMGQEGGVLEQNLARSLISQRRYQEAARALTRAAKLEPRNWRIESLLGDCHQNLGQTGAALTHWEKALDLLPTSSREYHRLRHKVRIETWRNQSPLRPKRGVSASRSRP